MDHVAEATTEPASQAAVFTRAQWAQTLFPRLRHADIICPRKLNLGSWLASPPPPTRTVETDFLCTTCHFLFPFSAGYGMSQQQHSPVLCSSWGRWEGGQYNPPFPKVGVLMHWVFQSSNNPSRRAGSGDEWQAREVVISRGYSLTRP